MAKRVLIVGGGSAGWITGAYLNALLNSGGRKVVEITLVESPDIPRISVGEATIVTIRQILQTVGLDELTFMKATDATFKQAIKFANWNLNDGTHYYHPFSRYNPSALDRQGEDWLSSDRNYPFAEAVSAQPGICEAMLSPQMAGKAWDFGPYFSYAYHMNAHKFADCLTGIGTANGITHILDDVVDIEMADDGRIAAVQTKGGQRLEADLFVDCTGFAGVLIEKKLGAGWDDFSQWLLCDRAVTMHVPYEHHYPGYVRPYTTSTALSAGWIWDIPMVNTRSLGYVYSSQFISDDEAEAEMRAFEGSHCDGLPSRIVNFRVGRRQNPWTSNCISIGLSGGFIEPLESTGIYLAQLGAHTLAEHFPHGDDMAPLAGRYNEIMSNAYDEILEFINLHYCLTRRTDTEFWREVGKPERTLPRLKDRLEFWSHKSPSRADFENQFTLFSHQSYEFVLYGMSFPEDYYPFKDGEARPAISVPEFISERVASAPEKLPTHAEWLRQIVGMQEYSSASKAGSVWGGYE